MQRPCTTRIPDGLVQIHVRIREKKEQGVAERRRPGKKKSIFERQKLTLNLAHSLFRVRVKNAHTNTLSL